MQSIFSTYKQGENRVTSSIIQVLKNLPINVVEKFLMMFTETENQDFFNFNNQPKGEGSIPDAEISANFKLFFETKIKINDINSSQLHNHLKLAEEDKTKLVYLTPDKKIPNDLKKKDLLWKNFQDVHDLISELFKDDSLILSERDQFLLRNLQEFFDQEGLLPVDDEVVIVAANKAWPAYKKHGLYVCQAGRSFKNVNYVGFYADGSIQTLIAKIKSKHDNFNFSLWSDIENYKCIKPALKKKLNSWLKENEWAKNKKTLQIFDLSTEIEEQGSTIKLNRDLSITHRAWDNLLR